MQKNTHFLHKKYTFFTPKIHVFTANAYAFLQQMPMRFYSKCPCGFTVKHTLFYGKSARVFIAKSQEKA